MARLIQPRPDPDVLADVLLDVFRRHGFATEASALAAVCRAVGLGDAGPLDPLQDDYERVAEHVASELRKLAPSDAPIELLLLLEMYVLQQAVRQGFRNWNPDEPTLIAAALRECARRRADLSEPLRAAWAIVKHGPAQLKPIAVALFSAGHVDPLNFLDADAVRTTTKRTGGSSWNQPSHDNDPRLPDFWLTLDPIRAFDAFRRWFEAEQIETLGALALGLERQIGLQYPGTRIARGPKQEIEIRELYPQVETLALVLCRRRSESQNDNQTLTRCCWSYARLAGERAPALLGDLYEPLARRALSELEHVRKGLRGADAEAFLRDHGDYLHEAVFFGPRTSSDSLWPVLRRLVLALREVPRRGVPLDLRTWDEPEPEFEKVPRPWNWVVDHIARVLELLLGRELERDDDLNELRREFAKFCLDRIKTREKARADRPLANEDFFEPKPEWRAAYINAAKELHPNLGERGHHVLGWSRDHDPDEDVRDAARSAAEVIRHGHGLPKNTSPRRAMFAAFWWLRQAHVISLGERVDESGAQRTFRKEMRRQADLEK
jgi:hypothetical protein